MGENSARRGEGERRMTDYRIFRGQILIMDKPALDGAVADFEKVYGRPVEPDDVLLTSFEWPGTHIKARDVAYREVST